MKQQILTQALHIALEYLLPALGGVLVTLLSAGYKWVLAHVHNTRALGILNRLQTQADQVVRALLHTTLQRVLEASADGKITAAELAEIRAAAVQDLREYLGQRGIADLARVVDVDAIEKALMQAVEAALHNAAPHSTSP